MRYIDSSSIGALSSIFGMGSRSSSMLGMLFGFGRKKRLTKAQRKKLARRRYRTFVDNIVMHHKRLHDKNRETVINLAKVRNVAPRQKPTLRTSLTIDTNTKWRDRTGAKERIVSLRGRVDTRRIRARSRWVSVVTERSSSDDNRPKTYL